MNSKLIQSSWCYRYKLLSLWINSIHIIGFFYIQCILKMCYKNMLVQGWVRGKAKAYFWVQGWVGVQKWPFWGIRTLWMAPSQILETFSQILIIYTLHVYLCKWLMLIWSTASVSTQFSSGSVVWCSCCLCVDLLLCMSLCFFWCAFCSCIYKLCVDLPFLLFYVIFPLLTIIQQ